MRTGGRRGFVSTGALVGGALLVGQAIHDAVVTGAVAMTAPGVVVPVVLGVALIYGGYRLKPAVTFDEAPDGSSGSGDADAEYDPSLSPLGDDEPADDD